MKGRRLQSLARRALLHVRRLHLRIWARPIGSADLIRVGTAYGGWWVPARSLSERSVCCCAGVGEDVSFDVGLIARFRCRVVSVDPTPRAQEYVKSETRPSELTFLPIGLGGRRRVERFYAPKDPAHVSHSITNIQGTSTYFEAPLLTLADIAKEVGVARFDLLKMDIEGAHHEVIASLRHEEILPEVLLVEFDQPERTRMTRASLSALREIGYTVLKTERFNVTCRLSRPSLRGAEQP